MSKTLDAFEIKAIPTSYRGVQLKSRMEAQCCVLFDKLGWEWEYEKHSLMLPGGVTFIPDFWIRRQCLVVECRGYESARGRRQIDDFAREIEGDHGFREPITNNRIIDFLVIGPDRTALYRGYAGYWTHRDTPATEREFWQLHPGVLFKCECGWGTLNKAGWCPNCEKQAIVALALTVEAGKIFANGIAVENLGGQV